MLHDASWREEETLADGTRVAFRLVRPDDKTLLLHAFAELSQESRLLRFFTEKDSLAPAELAYLTEMDQVDHFALGATTPEGEEGLGIARFVRVADRRDTAEAALVVADSMRRRGLGGRLLTHLIQAASERGIRRFRCEVLATNEAMHGFLEQLGPPAEARGDEEIVTLEWELPPASDQGPIRRLLRLAGEGLVVLRHALFPWQERG